MKKRMKDILKNNKEETEEKTVETEAEEKAEAQAAEEQTAEETAAEEAQAEAAEEAADPVEELNRKVNDLNDRLVRNMAEFDNYRKRTDKEKAARFDMGARSVVEKILPILDNFERGLATLDEAKLKEDPFAQGMDKTCKQMVAILEELGVVPIEAVGKPFNPDFHNAVLHEENPDVGENIITEELQKGYTYNGTVVRYSMVKVAN